MDWNTVSAIAAVVTTISTFISILLAVRYEKNKNKFEPHKVKSTLANIREEVRVKQIPTEKIDTLNLYRKLYGNPRSDLSFDEVDDRSESEKEFKDPTDLINQNAPFLFISVGLIGASGGIASILVPWLLIQATPDLQFILYILLVTGLLGGVIFAFVMDRGFHMDLASPWLRFPLSAISGIIGGWLGVLIIIGVIIYLLARYG